jgi:hypothetical protein
LPIADCRLPIADCRLRSIADSPYGGATVGGLRLWRD